MEIAKNKTDQTPCPQELTVSSLYFPIVSPSLLGFHASSAGKESACNAGDSSSIPGSGRCPRQGHGYPLQLFLPGESQWTEEPGRLQSMESQRVGHNWVTFTSLSSSTATQGILHVLFTLVRNKTQSLNKARMWYMELMWKLNHTQNLK